MSQAPLLDTSTVDLNTLFSNGKRYRVPDFQRDYSWSEEEWEDLWSDIVEIGAGSQPHYMGAIVLQESDNGLIVIDGQQRLATLSIVVLAVLAKLQELIAGGVESAANEERLNLLRQQFIGGKHPASLQMYSKLSLNRNDDGFYQQLLIQFRTPLNPRKLRDSEGKLWSAYRFFFDRISGHYATTLTGSRLAEFLEMIATKLLFIQIKVVDDLSAYTVFETLNARGLELTATDLLKNFLFSKAAASETDLAHVRDQWKRITETVRMREFPTFLRHFINSRQSYVRRERLFKILKADVVGREDVFRLLDELESAAYWFAAMDDCNDDLWKDYDGCKQIIRVLNLFAVTQYKSLILACAATSFPAGEIRRVLQTCLVISLRYNMICQKNPSRLEEAYNVVAVGIRKGDIKTAKQVADGLGPIYVSDEEFKNAFETSIISTRSKGKLVSYILCKLEQHLSQADLDFENSSATIEHILPENPSSAWEATFDEESRERFTYRLGNYTLLERTPNRTVGNSDFIVKREAYEQSQYQVTKKIVDDEWTPDSVSRRQAAMAKWAAAVWRLE